MELTSEQKGRILAMYIGSPMRLPEAKYKPKRLTNVGILQGDQWCFHREKEEDSRSMNSGIKLLLRPLSAITDEDARQVMNIQQTGFYCSESDFNVTNKALSYRHKTDGHWHLYDLAWDCMYSETAQFLAARGYAIPIYFAPSHQDNGKTAIELGLAIEMPA